MLINGKRALAYSAKVTGITAMDAERLESVDIRGWHCVCGKGEFAVGDLGVFIEVDSLCPETEPFKSMEFLVNKKYRIKTQKIRGVYSQGLFVPLSAFSSEVAEAVNGKENVDLTDLLGVTYYVVEDNKRKGAGGNRETGDVIWRKLQAKYPMLRHNFPKFIQKLFVKLLGKKVRKPEWPFWVVKTDEERVQNLDYQKIIEGAPWIVTEKIDGTSATFTAKREKNGKITFLVCSRNVVFDSPNAQCYYDTNVYTEIAERYHLKEAMTNYLKSHIDLDFVTIQGEIFGAGVQKRTYSMDGIDLRVFNLITSDIGRWPTNKMVVEIKNICSYLQAVPIVTTIDCMPETADKLLEMADGPSCIDSMPREGFVFRSEDGTKSFKAVSNKYLVKYHG